MSCYAVVLHMSYYVAVLCNTTLSWCNTMLLHCNVAQCCIVTVLHGVTLLMLQMLLIYSVAEHHIITVLLNVMLCHSAIQCNVIL